MKLNLDEVWEDFLQYKLERKHLSNKEQEIWTNFIRNKEYREVTQLLISEGYCFDYPVKMSVNKSGTGKKRIVYSFSEKETMVLKGMAYLLYQYDDKISPCCYSFRRDLSAKDAIIRILRIAHLEKKYCLKVDVSNYFNSIPHINYFLKSQCLHKLSILLLSLNPLIIACVRSLCNILAKFSSGIVYS